MAKVCDCGFHACENPIDCLAYYGPYKSVYREVELDGEKYKPDTWYTLKNGKVVEVEDGE